MKRHLPSVIELSLFLAMALISTVIVAISPQRDTALFACTLPIFLVASLLGFRRSEIAQVSEVAQEADDDPIRYNLTTPFPPPSLEPPAPTLPDRSADAANSWLQ